MPGGNPANDTAAVEVKLDARYWILDTGYWILDVRYWMVDVSAKIIVLIL
jgi:hypothetical protein